MMDKIRKNTILSILMSLIRFAYPAVSFAYAARILRPDGLGMVQFAAAFSAYFVMVTGLGMPIYGLRETAGCSEAKLHVLVGELFLIRSVFGLASFGLFILFMPVVQSADHVLLIIYGLNILFAIPECEWLYKGREDYTVLTAVSTASRIVGILALVLFVLDSSDIYIYAWITSFLALVVNLSEFVIADVKWKLRIRKNVVRIIRDNRVTEAVKRHLPSLMLFFLMSCAVTIYSHTDVVMLGFIKDSRDVGIYSCAAKIKTVLPVITGALWAAALPRATELWNSKNQKGFEKLADRSFHTVQVVMVPLVIYFVIFAGPCACILGGEEYLEAAVPMRLLVLAVFPIGVSNIAGGQILIPTGKEKKLFIAEAAGAVSNIAMNAVLIPVLSSAGAAIATALSETLVAILSIRFVARFSQVRAVDWKTMGKVAVSCVTAGTSALLLLTGLSDLWVVMLSIIWFGMLYGAAMTVMRDEFFLGLFRSGKALYRKIIPECIRMPLGKARKQIFAVLYRGYVGICGSHFRYYCPCCRVKIKRFKAGGYADQPETYNRMRYVNCDQRVICPVCGALPRHRILASWCDLHRDELRGDILYFALELPMSLWMGKNKIRILSADLYHPADLKLDIQATGQKDKSYDWIFCNHVLEHVTDYRRALDEIYRILKPGGHLICSFPIDPEFPGFS